MTSNIISKKRYTDREMKFYGFQSCLELFKRRPHDIIRVYVQESKIKNFTHVFKWCSQNKKAYHIVSEHELDRITESVHHEGVCILAKEIISPTFEEMLTSVLKNEKVCLLFLDGVQNPHNIGSIMRASSHFGIKYILGDEKTLPALSASACRVAIGAQEHVFQIMLKDSIETLRRLKKEGFSIIATSSHKGESLYKHKFSNKILFILGSEQNGISPIILKEANITLQIPGSRNVESLNVSIASSIFMSEAWRQQNG
ncbi:MAG: TrmH family RNA methyltransferase [Parachlamydiales bacterium]|jgi:TrmH RNA methyltransferase